MKEKLAAHVDFNRITGKLNPKQHGCNMAPGLSNRGNMNLDAEIRALHFHSSRTHDWSLWNPGQRIIDTHFVFPLMKEDPADPSNYYFKASDAVIRNCRNTGMNIFYRLGTSIEHSGGESEEEHYNTIVPEDFEKYAEVLAGIIRHYTRGWADGCHSDMEYWEIWNEPDLGCRMWTGSIEEFIRFFVIVLKRLKSEFPELKIGGPGLCGLKEEFFRNMLAACREAGTAPDFISWHCYTSNVEQLAAQPARGREMLDSLGFTGTETCINEWHYGPLSWESVQRPATAEIFQTAVMGPAGLHGIDSGVFNLSVLAAWQNTPLDSGFYYGAGIDSNWGFRDPLRSWTKNYYSMKMFGEIIANYTDKVCSGSMPEAGTVRTLGALSEDGRGGALLVADYRGIETMLNVRIKGMDDAKFISARILDDTHDGAPIPVFMNNGILTLAKNRPGSAAFLVCFQR